MKKPLVFVLTCLTLFLSCNVHFEKRLYRKGYYVDVISNKNTTKTNREVGKNTLEVNYSALNNEVDIPVLFDDLRFELVDNDNAIASVNNSIPVEISNFPKTFRNANNSSYTGKIYSQPEPVKELVEVTPDIEPGKSINGDSDLYILALLMGLVVFGLFRFSQRISLNMSRWASKNKTITKLIVAMMQINLGYFGVMTGKNLFDLGYTFSDNLEYIFGGIISLAILNLMLRKPADNITVPRSYYARKLNILAILLSYFMITVAIGNKLGDHRAQISPLGYVAEKTYDAAYPSPDEKKQATIESSKSYNDDGSQSFRNGNINKLQKSRKVFHTKGDGTGWPAWYIVIYILLCLVLICAMVMMFIFTPIGAAVPVSIICAGLMVAVPILMARRVRLGNIKRRPKKEKKVK